MQRGFTLLELMVTLSIMAILSSILILYSRTGEKQIVLFKEQAKVVSSIMRAKSLAIQTFSEKTSFPEGTHLCGYGVHFYDDGRFIIFRDISDNCSATGNRYSESASGDLYELVNGDKLAGGLEFSLGGLTEIFFLPPEPKTELWPASPTQALILIRLTTNTANSVKIKITNAGQVTTQ